ncbi:MAG: SH3 domain-containing protein [Cyanobacteria bacterium]|nr:SH3 domain-containing protein [Cyanobacteriota bacterium]
MEPESLRSFIKKPSVIIGSLVALGAIGGTTIAMLQPSPSIDSRSGTGKIPEGAGAIVSQSSSPQVSAKRSTSPSSDPTAKPLTSAETSTTTDSSTSDKDGSTGSTAAPESLRLVERCETTMGKINDPNPPANVRSQPTTAGSSPDSPIVGTLKNGMFVMIVDQRDDWFKISTPMKGWVAKKITLSGCNRKEERVKFAKNRKDTTIADEFIGTGSHVYTLYLLKGQTLTLNPQKGPRPTVIAPNGKVLVESFDESASWSGKLPQSGNYQITLDSNFKGYNYSFEVVAD